MTESFDVSFLSPSIAIISSYKSLKQKSHRSHFASRLIHQKPSTMEAPTSRSKPFASLESCVDISIPISSETHA